MAVIRSASGLIKLAVFCFAVSPRSNQCHGFGEHACFLNHRRTESTEETQWGRHGVISCQRRGLTFVGLLEFSHL